MAASSSGTMPATIWTTSRYTTIGDSTDQPLVERLEAASDRLQSAGWTEAGSDLSGPDPGVGLTKGPAQLLLGSDIQPDGDALGFSIRGSCYRTESGDAGRIGTTRKFDFGR